MTKITRPPNFLTNLSTKWSDDIRGNHDLRWFDDFANAHPDGVWDGTTIDLTNASGSLPPFYDHADYLCPLILAYDYVQQLGWAEHTSDWDWYVGIQTRDGVWHGDDYLTKPDNEDPDDDDTVFEDTIEMYLPNGDRLTWENRPFGLIGDPDTPDYGDIRFVLPNVNESILLRDIAIVHINER